MGGTHTPSTLLYKRWARASDNHPRKATNKNQISIVSLTTKNHEEEEDLTFVKEIDTCICKWC